MKLLIVNPNTSVEMTQGIREAVREALGPGSDFDVVQPDFGPESLESYYDYNLAAFGVSRLLKKARDYDGVLIACYGDPGLYGFKEICSCPVLGIAEASISLSLLMGYKFGILAASNKAVPMMRNMVAQYGLSDRFAGIWPLDMSVLDVEANKDEALTRLIETGKAAVDAGAEVLILGCAGMTGLKLPVEEALGVPIIDPLECGCKILEMMAGCGYSVSKKGLYATPMPKSIARKDLLE
ncbi:MAG: aspartate/glutamate racemase family protein [Bacillota bacterium]